MRKPGLFGVVGKGEYVTDVFELDSKLLRPDLRNNIPKVEIMKIITPFIQWCLK
jgi:hypothetical protein